MAFWSCAGSPNTLARSRRSRASISSSIAARSLGLMGDNGAGKSTLVKVIAGSYPTDARETMRIDGEPDCLLHRPIGGARPRASRSSIRTSPSATTWRRLTERLPRPRADPGASGRSGILDTARDVTRARPQPLRRPQVGDPAAATWSSSMSGGQRQAVAIARTRARRRRRSC